VSRSFVEDSDVDTRALGSHDFAPYPHSMNIL
jgi:hypothetical protein